MLQSKSGYARGKWWLQQREFESPHVIEVREEVWGKFCARERGIGVIT